MCWLFMVMKKINKNQTELGIRTYDFNVPEDHMAVSKIVMMSL